MSLCCTGALIAGLIYSGVRELVSGALSVATCIRCTELVCVLSILDYMEIPLYVEPPLFSLMCSLLKNRRRTAKGIFPSLRVVV